ncbi:MAG TPA: hypothetical protein VLZ78_01975 [Terrimesophilobacter sp.]|nr:hypothetical protein [Terrimesophilobacter sp.]
MSERNDPEPAPDEERMRAPALLKILAVLLFAEAAALAAGAAFLLVEILVETPQSYAAAVAILALTALAAVWLAIIGVNTLRGRPWVRAAAMVWQVLQIGLGIGSMQGLFPRADIGWFLIVPAVVVIALLFTGPVLAATRRDS